MTVKPTQQQRQQIVRLLTEARERLIHKRYRTSPLFEAMDDLGHAHDLDMDQIANWACDAIDRTGLPMSVDQLRQAIAYVETNVCP